AGFFAFLPTSYSGVAELGLIAGFGMVINLALSLTLLPALIRLLHPKAEQDDIGYRQLAPVDVFLRGHARGVVIGGAVLGLGGWALMPFLTFDSNPLDLRDPVSESVATLNDMAKNPDTTPNTIEVLEPTEAQADAMAQRLSALPEVRQVVTLNGFIP